MIGSALLTGLSSLEPVTAALESIDFASSQLVRIAGAKYAGPQAILSHHVDGNSYEQAVPFR